MTFKEIANSITGISCPVFGISWNPPKLESKIAERVIIFLEDKRVLYNPYDLEMPDHCVQSIDSIRKFLTEQLFDVGKDAELNHNLRAMRSACRKFLDMTTMNNNYFKRENGRIGHNMGLGGQMLFYSGIGELRGTFGVLIAQVLVMYGIDCESELLTILPLEITDGN